MMSYMQFADVLSRCACDGFSFLAGMMGGGGYFLQVSRGNIRGRKWYVSPHAVVNEVVQTALKAVLTFLEHEAREQFTYRSRPIFGPHFDVEELAERLPSSDVRVQT